MQVNLPLVASLTVGVVLLLAGHSGWGSAFLMMGLICVIVNS